MRQILGILLGLGATTAWGAETDSITGRDFMRDHLKKHPEMEKQAQKQIENLLRRSLQQSIDAYNDEALSRRRKTCDQGKLFKIIERTMDKNLPQPVWKNSQPYVGFKGVGLDDSIYRGNRDLSMKLAYNPIVIPMNGVLFGLDKLDHMLSSGWLYYKVASVKKKGLAKGFELGLKQENGWHGLKFTGIKSYGDLAANYSGYLFWKSLFEGFSQPFAATPAITCSNGLYVLSNRSLYLDKLITPAFDEALNCNDYAPDVAEAFKRNFAERAKGKACPIEADACKKLMNHPLYRNGGEINVIPYVLNPKCSLDKNLMEEGGRRSDKRHGDL